MWETCNGYGNGKNRRKVIRTTAYISTALQEKEKELLAAQNEGKVNLKELTALKKKDAELQRAAIWQNIHVTVLPSVFSIIFLSSLLHPLYYIPYGSSCSKTLIRISKHLTSVSVLVFTAIIL